MCGPLKDHTDIALIFASDNWAGAHPKIAENLAKHASGLAAAYGGSDLDRKVANTFNEIFEREVAVFFVGTGTAANSLAMSAVARPGGVVLCHRDAHMIADECGAPEYFTHGRLSPVDGQFGRIDSANLESAIAKYPPAFVHSGQPAAISITQATEIGTVYDLAQIGAISEIAKHHDLPLHMDGARFGNALVSLDVTPAEMTWKSGVDIVSFGGTKNGCWCAEAIVFMKPEQSTQFPFIRKRAAQLFSKSRFIAAQFEAYFSDDLWLESARHANAMTQRLAQHIENSASARLGWAPQANELFPVIKTATIEKLQKAGVTFYPWSTPRDLEGLISADESLCRFVTSFATTAEDVDQLGALL